MTAIIMMLPLLVLSLLLGRCVSFQGSGTVRLPSRSRSVACLSAPTLTPEYLLARTERDLHVFHSVQNDATKTILFEKALRKRDLDIAVLRRTADSLRMGKTLEEAQREAREEDKLFHALLRRAQVSTDGEIASFWERIHERGGVVSLLETIQLLLLRVFVELRVVFPAETQQMTSFEEVIRLCNEKRAQIEGMESSGLPLTACKTMYAQMGSKMEVYESYYEKMKKLPQASKPVMKVKSR